MDTSLLQEQGNHPLIYLVCIWCQGSSKGSSAVPCSNRRGWRGGGVERQLARGLHALSPAPPGLTPSPSSRGTTNTMEHDGKWASPGRVQATRNPGLARSLDNLSNTPEDSFAKPQDYQLLSLPLRPARRGPESSDEVGRAAQLKELRTRRAGLVPKQPSAGAPWSVGCGMTPERVAP